MAHSDWMDSTPVAAAACPAPMTRAALLALRAANALRAECPYIITDHVQNRLVAGTTITLHAVSANELSEQVEVNTTYDNEAWAGIYDLDRALVLELTDNRGNVAKGINGTEVANFDWGNTAYTGCRVEAATLTVTYGASAGINQLTVINSATLNLTGFTGVIRQCTVADQVSVNLSGANGSWLFNTWKNGGNFNAPGYSGGGTQQYNEFDAVSVNLNVMSGVAAIRNNEIAGGSITAQGAATFFLQSCNLQNMFIFRSATGGAFNVTLATSDVGGNINHTGAGALNMAGTRTAGFISLTGVGGLTANYCDHGPGCSISHGGLGVMSLTRTHLHGGGTIAADAGSNKAFTVNDCHLMSGSTMRIIGAVAGGAFAVTTTEIASGSYIYHRGAGVLSVTQSQMQGSSVIDVQAGNRSYSLSRLNMRAVSRVTMTGTGAFTDGISDIDMGGRGVLSISCSGAANSVSYCVITGLSAAISFTGTTGGQAVNRLKCMDGSITFANCTVNTGVALCEASDSGVISFNSVTSAKQNNYLQAKNGSTITINNSTGGGRNDYITTEAFASFVQSGTAASASRVDVAQGTVSHNGGTLQVCHKRLTGTLTTGNFNHSNIVHIMPSNRTLTAANTNRGEYVGLAPAAYAAGGILV